MELFPPDDLQDETAQQMRSYAALAFALSAQIESEQIAERVWPVLQDEVCGVALFAATSADAPMRLCSGAGFSQRPPRDGLVEAFAGSPLAAVFDDAAPEHVICPEHGTLPAWLGAECGCVATFHFGPGPGHAARGIVLFAVRAPALTHAFSALLRLVAQRMWDCFVRRPGGAGLHRVDGWPDKATKVLLVDDEPLMVAHVGQQLRRRGFHFHGTGSAAAGLAAAAAIHPDVILVDKILPDMDGIELLRRVRSDDRLSTVPVIMLSGIADEAVRVRALRAGADDYVGKPFSVRELVARIQANVRMAQVRREAVQRESELLRLRESQRELRTLLDTVQKVRTDERRMLAREVHDQLGQLLTLAKLDIRLVQERVKKDGLLPAYVDALGELRSACSSIDQAIASVQNISMLLRPPALEAGGLIAAMQWQAGDLRRRSRIDCRVVHDPKDYVEPSQFVAGELLRICQEALTNVLRHAHASCVLLHVAVRRGKLVVRICDNGMGIPHGLASSPQAIGITGIRERAASIRATLNIRSGSRGTMIAVRRGLMLP